MPTLSAVQSVSPAFDQTARQLFRPFRIGHWARLAIVSLATGEFVGGGWGGGNLSVLQNRGRREDLLGLAGFDWSRLREFFPLIIVAVLAVVALGVLWMYVGSVFRFILLDAVLNDRCAIRAGWRRWKDLGTSFFFWCLAFGFVLLACLGVFIVGPIILAWQAGIFRQPGQHLLLLILGGLALFLLMFVLLLGGAVVYLFARDFVVPIMVLENLRATDAWDRLLPMLRTEKPAYAGYILMKIVLAVGSAILFGILNVIVILALLIPLGITGLALFLIGKAAGLSWNLWTVGAVVLLGGAALTLLLYAISFADTPALVFFQAYPLHFLGSRYPTLGALLSRTPPLAPPLSPPISA